MQIKKWYTDYQEFRSYSIKGLSTVFQDSPGSVRDCPAPGYGADILIEDGVVGIDLFQRVGYRVDYLGNKSVCSVGNLPESEEEFWESVIRCVKEYVKVQETA